MKATRWEHRFSGRAVRSVVASLVLIVGLQGMTPAGASSASCGVWTLVPPSNPSSTMNGFDAVAAIPSARPWAVGRYSNGTADQTLIEHTNGTIWKRVPSPSPGGSSNHHRLFGVAVTSATDAWAVGGYFNGTTDVTLTERWNGTAWKRVRSRNPGTTDNRFESVAATSPGNTWAVGYYSNGTEDQTLIERWNGTAWKRVQSKNPGGSSNSHVLTDVAATSSTDAWAVGGYYNGTNGVTLTERWNGTAWKWVPSPSPGQSSLYGVAATSSTDAWAVGYYWNGSAVTLVEHWDGTAWAQVPSPNGGGGDSVLVDVAAISPNDVWAVGSYFNGSVEQALIEHWDGTGWTLVPSPNLGSPYSVLEGVSATSSSDVWAVGSYLNGTAYQTLALHWC